MPKKIADSVPTLIDRLDTSKDSVAHPVIASLARAGRRAVPALTRLMKDESGGIRMNALQSLIVLKGPNLGRVLVAALSDPQWYIRLEAAKACGELNITAARKKLRDLSKDARPGVRKAAAAALERLKPIR